MDYTLPIRNIRNAVEKIETHSTGGMRKQYYKKQDSFS